MLAACWAAASVACLVVTGCSHAGSAGTDQTTPRVTALGSPHDVEVSVRPVIGSYNPASQAPPVPPSQDWRQVPSPALPRDAQVYTITATGPADAWGRHHRSQRRAGTARALERDQLDPSGAAGQHTRVVRVHLPCIRRPEERVGQRSWHHRQLAQPAHLPFRRCPVGRGPVAFRCHRGRGHLDDACRESLDPDRDPHLPRRSPHPLERARLDPIPGAITHRRDTRHRGGGR